MLQAVINSESYSTYVVQLTALTNLTHVSDQMSRIFVDCNFSTYLTNAFKLSNLLNAGHTLATGIVHPHLNFTFPHSFHARQASCLQVQAHSQKY